MTFLNTAFLFLLSAVSIPLIIHFLSKRRIRTVEFSSLKFLEQMQKSRMRWLRIKELILLALRMLVIALIVLAFARPTLRGFAGSSKAQSSAVVILDRSVSMDAEGETGSLFEEARRLAGKLIDSFDAGDQITLIASPGDGSPLIIGPTNPGERLKEKLAAIEIGYQAGKMGDALKAARDELSRSPNLNREIYLLSDMQSHDFAELPREVIESDAWKNTHIFLISPSPTGDDNVGITDILMPSQLLVPGENYEIESELVNSGRGRLENVLVGAVIDGERRAQTTVSLPPAQPTRTRFSLKVDTPGDHGGFIEIDHDSFEPDNRRYFSFHIPEKINLLAVSQANDPSGPVRVALDRAEAGQIAYSGIGLGQLLREDLSGYDVILLEDIAALDASRESAIARFVDSGKGLLLSLGRSSDVAYWQKFLTDLAGISVGPLTGRNNEYLAWDNFDYEHPIFSVYSPATADRSKVSIPELRMFFYHDLGGTDIIGSSSSGIDLLAESTAKPVLVFGSGFDLASNDLPAHSFFIPFLVRSVEYLATRELGGAVNGTIGQPSLWNLPENVISGLTLLSPSGATENLQPNPDGAGSSVMITEYGPPGIYRLLASDLAAESPRQISLLAFNIDKSESRPETISPDELSDRMGASVVSVSPDSDLKTTVLQARFGRELWKEFLLLALVFLIIESLLGRTSPPKIVEGK